MTQALACPVQQGLEGTEASGTASPLNSVVLIFFPFVWVVVVVVNIWVGFAVFVLCACYFLKHSGGSAD